MSRPPSPKSELEPISMGDEGDQQTTGGGESSGGGNVDHIPPPSPQYRVHREPGKSLWQLQGLSGEESITLEIIKQGVKNSKGAISRSHSHWLHRFEVADQALIISMGDIEYLTKDEAVASREYTDAKHKIESNFESYRGLLDIWLCPP